MPEATRVWLVELGPASMLEERKGTLFLDDDRLRFEPVPGTSGETSIPLAAITKVRRLRGSPVIVVTSRRGGSTLRTALYFAQPPPLTAFERDPTETRTLALPKIRDPKRRARRHNVGYLGAMNRAKKGEVVEWEREVRTAVESARGTGAGG